MQQDRLSEALFQKLQPEGIAGNDEITYFSMGLKHEGFIW